MISVATAECFTHGRVGREIHFYSRGYPLTYSWNICPSAFSLTLVAGMFIPTLTAVRNVLRFEPLIPVETIGDIKVYNQKQDLVMAVRMAEAIRSITGAQIGIGTTAGMGEGGIAVVSDHLSLTSTSSVYADLRFSDVVSILNRQEAGVVRSLQLLEDMITRESSQWQMSEHTVSTHDSHEFA